MKILNFINLLVFIFFTHSAFSESSIFAFGKYDTKENKKTYGKFEKLNQVLKISDADELEISVTGRIEDKCGKRYCDVLRIYNSEGKEIKALTGQLNTHFSVIGSSITVTFRSDGKTEYEGAIVSIAQRSLNHVFDELKEKLLKSVDIILKYGANDIYAKIDKSYQIVNALHDKLSDEGKVKELIEEILQRLVEIAHTYKEINAMRNDIVKVHKLEFEKIQHLKNDVLSNMQKIEQKKEKYLNLLDKAEQSFVNLDDSQEKKKLELSIAGYKNIIQNIDIQKSVLSNFDTFLNTLNESLRKHTEKILMLLYILEINAQVYEQAANIPLMNQNFAGSFANLNNLAEIKSIVADMEKSEQEIQKQVETLQKTRLE